jgi:hypothetical protein
MELIVTTKEDLQTLITDAVSNCLQQLGSLPVNNNQSEIIDGPTLRARLNISVPTEIRHRKRKLYPFMKVGNVIRYNWPEVVKALESKKAKG